MNEKDIVTAAMKSCGWTQEELATQAGYKTQSAISNRLNGKSMRVDTFVKLLASMGYEVAVISTSPNKNKNKWIVSTEKDNLIVDTDLISGVAALSSTAEPLTPSAEEKLKGVSRNGRIKLK